MTPHDPELRIHGTCPCRYCETHRVAAAAGVARIARLTATLGRAPSLSEIARDVRPVTAHNHLTQALGKGKQ